MGQEEELARAYKLAVEEKAMAEMRGLLEDFPGIEDFMASLVGMLSEAAKDLPLDKVIYKCLMTGATLTAARYRHAQNTQEELISRIKGKKT